MEFSAINIFTLNMGIKHMRRCFETRDHNAGTSQFVGALHASKRWYQLML